MGKNSGIRIYRNLIEFFLGLYITIAVISISTLLVLNFTPIYRLIIDKYNLVLKTGLTKGQLSDNYKILINYLQNPFIKKLNFPDFIMSKNGEIHFYEVKKIFLILMVISLIFIISIVAYYILHKIYNVDKLNLIYILNNSSNILIVFFITLITTFFIDFTWIFEIFHKIFFRNDYWIFDPDLDPVIVALPEELFMVSAIIILSILIITAITIKIFYYKNRMKKELEIELV